MKVIKFVSVLVTCAVSLFSAGQELPDKKIMEEFEKAVELFLIPSVDDFNKEDDREHGLGWVYGDCPTITFESFTDEPVKRVLQGIATNGTKDVFHRQTAIHSYIQRFNAQEVRDLFVFLLSDEEHFTADLKGLVICSVRRLFNSGVKTETQKREAILASLYVVVAREKDGRMFRSLDEFLQRNSDDYAASHQRVALLIKQANPPNTPPEAIAKKMQEIMQKSNRPFTSVSTNLTELLTHDFNKSK